MTRYNRADCDRTPRKVDHFMTEYVFGIDLGGTRLRAALLDRDLNILARREILTQSERGVDDTVARMADLVRAIQPTLNEDDYISGIGISAPGPTNPTTGYLVAPPNLHGWHNVPLMLMLQKTLGYSTFLGNDANVAALAEAARGAAVGYRHVIFLTISTGIGGGIITDGRLLLGKDGLGAEVGHMNLFINDRVSTLEKEAAGPALARQARARIEAGAASQMRELVNGDISAIDGKIVGDAALAGDALALEIVQRAGRVIGVGIASLLHIFNSEIVVLGGGVSTLGDLLFEPIREAMHDHVIDKAYVADLRLKPAALGENVSLIGAAALVVTKGGVEDVASMARKLDAD